MDASITCKCGSCDCVKAGMAHGKQRYKCRICGCRFVGRRSKLKSIERRQRLLSLYLEGLGIRSIGRLLGVCHTTVQYCIRRMAKTCVASVPEKSVHIEMDELYTYIGSKKQKCWLWIAISRANKCILGFVLGSRSTNTLRMLYEKIKDVSAMYYHTDNHGPYRKVLPEEKHRVYRGCTNTIEGINSGIRHYLARFRRRSKCYSKSIGMLEASLQLLMYTYNAMIIQKNRIVCLP